MGAEDPLAAVRETFRQECDDLISVARYEVHALRASPGDTHRLNALFRALHTIKGGAGAFSMHQISKRAHSLEGELEQLRPLAGSERAARLVGFIEKIDALARDIEIEFSGAPQTAGALLAPRLDHLRAGNEPRLLLAKLRQHTDCTILAELDEIPALEDSSLDDLYIRWAISGDLDAAERIAESFNLSEALHLSETNKVEKTALKIDVPTLRVGLHRVDDLMNLVGELVINQSMLLQKLDELNLPGHATIHRYVDSYQRLTRDLQSAVMQIRAQPLKSTFQRMAMVAREAAAAEGKNIDIEIHGADVEVDKTVVERLVEPLTHVVRNAVDHGIESQDDRIAVGKAERGKITISAQHLSGRVLIDVNDDGGGLHLDRLRAKARDAGLQVPKSDEDAARLIFEPGLSTSQSVGDISGRGVGMDSVRTSIEALGGTTHIKTTQGVGTQLRLSLPLTLALMDAMIVRTGPHFLALPLTSINETRILEPKDFITISEGKTALRTVNGILPALSAAALYGDNTIITRAVGLLITSASGPEYALLVDEIIEQRQIVVKGLSGPFLEAPAIFGATILGDGRVALILDPDQMNPGKHKHEAGKTAA